MARLLINETAYRRVRARLDAFDIEPVLMDESAVLRLNGAEITLEDARLEAGWASGDVFGSASRREFFVALLKSPSLRWIQNGGAGFDHPVFTQLMARGVELSTSHGHAVGIADYVLAGVLDHYQHGPSRRAAQAARRWERHEAREMTGSRWLVVGFGTIGQGVAARARAFGATITGVRRDMTPHPMAETLVPLDRVAEALPEADVVVLSSPLNDATRNLVDSGFLAAMKPGSVLVNVSRGGLVDEAALLEALDRGVPEHAVLDVFQTEPLPAESPFWGHPRVSLSSHDSGATPGFAIRNDEIFLQNLGRFLAGEPPANLVDPRDALKA